MIHLNPTVQIITLNTNVPDIPVKNRDPTFCCLQKLTLNIKAQMG